MPTTAPPKSDLMVLKDFFLVGVPAGQVRAELVQLTHEDKVQLVEGIRSGTLTY